MIKGRSDTYFTVEEFAAMVGRTPKTVKNWIADRRLKPRYLFGIPFVSLQSIENIIAEEAPPDARTGKLARRLMGEGR